RFRFSSDEKNKAENIMITDLLRHDIGKIGNVVRVPKVFTVTGYNTLYQMTSTVTGKVRRDIALYDLFAALFPSGSVTGAPKIRAMEIIKELESEERKIYTGAIGYISPDRDMYFNIPVRTLLINGQSGEMGIGGGIVWDSTVEGEWNEGMLKARFLTDIALQGRFANRPCKCKLPAKNCLLRSLRFLPLLCP
ncbi:MAG: chorismate-binding protein, partial [Candidatus Omnitrophica bacterium]|nr:chorismate-binding protein [Candidatus Omnitrophota bacterium]